MRKCLNVILIGTVASSCVNLNGDFVVKQEIKVKSKVGLFNLLSKKVVLIPGTYSADLRVEDQSTAMINLYFPKTHEPTIHIPISTSEESLNIPENGEFKVLGDTIAQPFDIEGTIKTTFSDSYKMKMYEECTFSPDSKFTRKGKRSLDLYYKSAYREVKLTFLEEDSSQVVAKFDASGRESKQVSDNYGPCL
jgi:hypothetical protein